jgi:hypothetical protein
LISLPIQPLAGENPVENIEPPVLHEKKPRIFRRGSDLKALFLQIIFAPTYAP